MSISGISGISWQSLVPLVRLESRARVLEQLLYFQTQSPAADQSFQTKALWIARQTSLCRKTVQRALDWLAANGFILKRTERVRGAASRFRIRVCVRLRQGVSLVKSLAVSLVSPSYTPEPPYPEPTSFQDVRAPAEAAASVSPEEDPSDQGGSGESDDPPEPAPTPQSPPPSRRRFGLAGKAKDAAARVRGNRPQKDPERKVSPVEAARVWNRLLRAERREQFDVTPKVLGQIKHLLKWLKPKDMGEFETRLERAMDEFVGIRSRRGYNSAEPHPWALYRFRAEVFRAQPVAYETTMPDHTPTPVAPPEPVREQKRIGFVIPGKKGVPANGVGGYKADTQKSED